MPNPPMSRSMQLQATFRALGCDHATVTYMYGWTDQTKKYMFTAGWHDESDRPPVAIKMFGADPLQLMVLGGIAMSAALAEQRPELTFPDVVWT